MAVGWLAGLNGNKTNSASVEVEVEVEAELGKIRFSQMLDCVLYI